jgi:hypothetical protein
VYETRAQIEWGRRLNMIGILNWGLVCVVGDGFGTTMGKLWERGKHEMRSVVGWANKMQW